ncbi:hypothetical protein CLI64_11000 [Nostoc sp. CENA543]|uniref:hypothetical protein n=1 Tax=Nostoc sp. CENA543 TaxID=1869241 RepID=UPI000CA20E90|nr:hypothetical protein [Nostoc sp. CENA543]AUT00881.1 hypothetical protein CLI64_11000 [Nostoc sp. CENA543]
MEVIGDSVEVILTREQVAKELETTTSVLYTILDLGSLYLPRLKRLRTKDNCGISRRRPLTNWDLPILRKVLHTYRIHGRSATRKLLAENPAYYEQEI